ERLRLADVSRITAVLLELAVELKHVAQVLGARESESPEGSRRHGVVPYWLTERLRQGLCHLSAGQMTAGNADGLADHLVALLEDCVGGLSDIFRRNRRQFLGPHWERDREFAISALLWTHAEVDEVLPVERRHQKRGWHTELGENIIRFAL